MTKHLSRAQLNMLHSVDDFGDTHAGIRGQSAHGGATGTIRVLVRDGWMFWRRRKRGGGRYILTQRARAYLRELADAETR